jgi:phosphoribosylglycinamide formyltransferase-1
MAVNRLIRNNLPGTRGLAYFFMRLGFLASHAGSNVEAVLDAIKNEQLSAQPGVVISNNRNAEVLRRAQEEGIPWAHLSVRTHPDPESLDKAILETLSRYSSTLVVLAGYMKKVGPHTLGAFRNRILNIHPALLPRHGGQGMYADRVHQAVLDAGDAVTGVTIHLVDEEYDHGQVIAQAQIAVRPDDTVESLKARVLELEHRFLPLTLQRIASGEITLPRPA